MEVDTEALEDDFSFQWGHLPLLWLLENEYLKCIWSHTQPNNRQFCHCSCGKKTIVGALGFLRKLSKTQNHWQTHHSMDGTHYGIRRCFIGPDNCSCWKTWVDFNNHLESFMMIVLQTRMEFPSAFKKNHLEWQKGSGLVNLSHLKRACT